MECRASPQPGAAEATSQSSADAEETATACEGAAALEALVGGRGVLPELDGAAAAAAAGLQAYWQPRPAPVLKRALLARVPQV